MIKTGRKVRGLVWSDIHCMFPGAIVLGCPNNTVSLLCAPYDRLSLAPVQSVSVRLFF